MPQTPTSGRPACRHHREAPVRVAYASAYPPQQYGVAAFTAELSRVTPDREIVAIQGAEPIPRTALEVHHRIRRDERDDYGRAAAALEGCVDVASVQFDSATWGGDGGSFVLDFVAGLRVPCVVTLHAVRRDPTPAERDVVARLVGVTGSAVVLSAAAAAALEAGYGIAAERVEVIPAGVPDTPIMDAAPSKDAVDAAGRDVVLGLGLLAPRKGFGQVIEALPGIVRSRPDVLFAMVGATHPDVRASEGEAHRQALAARAAALGVARHVRFVDEFVGRVELMRWLRAADVVVTPYTDLGTTHSGIVAQAMAAGRPIVATRFLHAVEVLDGGCGVLVPGTPAALERAVLKLLEDPALRAAVGARAHVRSRDWAWSRVGAAHHARLVRGAPAWAGAHPGDARTLVAAGSWTSARGPGSAPGR